MKELDLGKSDFKSVIEINNYFMELEDHQIEKIEDFRWLYLS